MYKGSKKQVMVIKGRGEGIFDEAHFILGDNSACEEDMVKEANRIIAEYRDYRLPQANKSKQKGATFWYICGLSSFQYPVRDTFFFIIAEFFHFEEFDFNIVLHATFVKSAEEPAAFFIGRMILQFGI